MKVDLPTFLLPHTKMTAQPSTSPRRKRSIGFQSPELAVQANAGIRAKLGLDLMRFTSAGADQHVQSISGALGHAETLDAADERNHSQTVERSVENRRHEFALNARERKRPVGELWQCSRHGLMMAAGRKTYHGRAEQLAEIREAGQEASQPSLHGLQQDDGRGGGHLSQQFLS